MLTRWWLYQPIDGGEWAAIRLLTIFGQPFIALGFLWRVKGPYKTEDEARRDLRITK